MFNEMKENPIHPNEFTFSCALNACSRLEGLEEGKQICGQFLKLVKYAILKEKSKLVGASNQVRPMCYV